MPTEPNRIQLTPEQMKATNSASLLLDAVRPFLLNMLKPLPENEREAFWLAILCGIAGYASADIGSAKALVLLGEATAAMSRSMTAGTFKRGTT